MSNPDESLRDFIIESHPNILAPVGRALADCLDAQAENQRASLGGDPERRAGADAAMILAAERYQLARREVAGELLSALRLLLAADPAGLRLLFAEILRPEREATRARLDAMREEIDSLARAVVDLETRQEADHESPLTQRWS